MGRNNADLFHGEYSYSFHPAPDDESQHIIRASHGGSTVGMLKWDAGHGEVTDLEVLPAHRRRGVATQMWHQANNHASTGGIRPPEHSSARTVQGEAWVRSLGERRVTPLEYQVPYIKRNKRDFLEMSESHYG